MIFVPSVDPEAPGGSGGWGGGGGESTTTYYPVITQSITATVGKRYVGSIYLRSGTPVTLYLGVGSARKEISVTGTRTRFELSAVASSTSLVFGIYRTSSVTAITLEMSWAMLEEGAVASTYCEGTEAADYTLSDTGLVTFGTTPGTDEDLTWTGDYYGSDAYEIATPWTKAQLSGLSFVQTADVIIFAHEEVPPQWLGRYDHANWSMLPLNYVGGPFEDINTDTSVTLQVSAVSGDNITLTASESIFTEDHIGRLVWVETKNFGTPWEPGKAVSTNDIRFSGPRYYKCKSGGTTGTITPSHYSDEASDGVVTWIYQDDGNGIGRITTVSGTTATAQVKKQFPAALTSTASHKWAFSPWSPEKGYPRAVTFHQQRLAFAGSTAYPNTVWLSRSGSYADFSQSNPIEDSDGLTLTVVSPKLNAFTGLISLGSLLALSSSGTWAIGTKEALSPTNVSADLQSYRGAAPIAPIGAGNTILFVQDKSSNVRDLVYEFVSNTYNGNDLHATASHLIKTNAIEEMAWQPSEDQLWCVRDDGTLLSCAYMRDQAVVGWARHDSSGGLYESVCCVPEGDDDVLYLSVNRSGVRTIERMVPRNYDDVRDTFFVDCGLTFDGRTGYRGMDTDHTSTTITITGGTNWDNTETLTATSNAILFKGPEKPLVEGPYPVGSLTSGHAGKASSAIKVGPDIYIGTGDSIYKVTPGQVPVRWSDSYARDSAVDNCEGQPTLVLSEDGTKIFNFTNSFGVNVRRYTTILTIGTGTVSYSSQWPDGHYVDTSTKHHVLKTGAEIRLLGIDSGEASFNYNTGAFLYYYWPDGPEHEFGTDLAFIDDAKTTILSFGYHYTGVCYAYTSAAGSYAGWTKQDYLSGWTAGSKSCWLTASHSVATGKIIILGPDTASDKAYSIEFDGTITELGSMNVARAHPGICRGEDGFIYVFGGYGAGGVTDRLDSVEKYNPDTDTWTLSSATMPYAAYDVAAVACDSGRILLVGGNAATDKTTQLNYYDPEFESWMDRDKVESAAVALATCIGGQLVFEDDNGVYRFTITQFNNSGEVLGRMDFQLPAAFRSTATTNWYWARDVLLGLDHLEGKTVKVLADGYVYDKTVSSGYITMDLPTYIAHVGLAITSDLEPLNLNLSTAETSMDKKKLVHSVNVVVEEGRGFKAGEDYDSLYEFAERPVADMLNLQSGLMEVNLASKWGPNGAFVLRQDDPLPLSILALIPNISVGGK